MNPYGNVEISDIKVTYAYAEREAGAIYFLVEDGGFFRNLFWPWEEEEDPVVTETFSFVLNNIDIRGARSDSYASVLSFDGL